METGSYLLLGLPSSRWSSAVPRHFFLPQVGRLGVQDFRPDGVSRVWSKRTESNLRRLPLQRDGSIGRPDHRTTDRRFGSLPPSKHLSVLTRLLGGNSPRAFRPTLRLGSETVGRSHADS